MKQMQNSADAPWMVTVVQAQLEEMAGACNQLHRSNRRIEFIVPIAQAEPSGHGERPTSHLAIFSLPKEEN